MKSFSIAKILCSISVFLFLTGQIFSQSDYEKMFKNTRELSKKALMEAGNIFAEKDFEKGTDLLADAEKLLKKNGTPEEIQQNLSSAMDYLNKSIEKAKTLNASFADLMKTRQLAINVEAYNNAVKLWEKGEDNFLIAVEDYNDKDMEGYQKYVKNAEANYKDAELACMKGRYLNGLNASIAQAEDKDLEEYAPVTLKKSKQLAQDIETVLIANRYDTLKARSDMNLAMYELDHGLYLEDLFIKMKENKKTMEDLVLSWEEPLTKIASEFKIPSSFDKGYDEITSKIIFNINDRRAKLDKALKDNQKLSSELDDLKKSKDELNMYLEEFKTKYAQLENENLQYKAQSEELDKKNQIIDTVSKLFLKDEAEIIRNGNLIIIRLIGIDFPGNKSTLDPKYYDLLGKVQETIKLFPNGTTVIECHTDGQGAFQKNFDLSQARANSIFEYLLSNMGAEASRITAVGLGSTKPIANNLSEEGRAKNRRIDIVIDPHFSWTK